MNQNGTGSSRGVRVALQTSQVDVAAERSEAKRRDTVLCVATPPPLHTRTHTHTHTHTHARTQSEVEQSKASCFLPAARLPGQKRSGRTRWAHGRRARLRAHVSFSPGQRAQVREPRVVHPTETTESSEEHRQVSLGDESAPCGSPNAPGKS